MSSDKPDKEAKPKKGGGMMMKAVMALGLLGVGGGAAFGMMAAGVIGGGHHEEKKEDNKPKLIKKGEVDPFEVKSGDGKEGEGGAPEVEGEGGSEYRTAYYSFAEEFTSNLKQSESLVQVALRLLAVERPVSALLERYGATATDDAAVHAMLDDLARRAVQGGIYAPSFAGFVHELVERFPAVRDDREFVKLLIDTLKIDRPAYQGLHAYMAAQGWPQWR